LRTGKVVNVKASFTGSPNRKAGSLPRGVRYTVHPITSGRHKGSFRLKDHLKGENFGVFSEENAHRLAAGYNRGHASGPDARMKL
jgi:hypothetical protein